MTTAGGNISGVAYSKKRRYRPGTERPPASLRPWLEDASSLTKRMRAACGDGFKLELLGQVRTRPLAGEARILNLPQRRFALVREVLLCCREDPWIFARSVVPMATLQGRHRRIAHLGVRPLGDFLFSSSGLKRGEIRVLPLHADPPMQAACTEALGTGPVGAWLRQSLFQLDRAPLLISEIFLPQ